MPSCSFACAVVGVEGLIVRVETDATAGTPAFSIIGLPDRSLNEARDRVRAAIANSGFLMPAGRLLVSLSPAHVRKEGSGFDLPIALALLAADGHLEAAALADYVALGELALDGALRAVGGTLPTLIAARRAGIRRALVPAANGDEARLVEGIATSAVPTLSDAVAVVMGNGAKFGVSAQAAPPALAAPGGEDFADVRGQTLAKRALEIAAAGGHNVVLIGPPGCGKTMLARRLPSILPPLTPDEALDVTAIHSIAGLLGGTPRIVYERPFRAPHHTISRTALVGGGGGGARHVRAKSPLPRAAFSTSTRSPSFRARRWKCCGSRSKTERSRSDAPPAAVRSRPSSRWSRR